MLCVDWKFHIASTFSITSFICCPPYNHYLHHYFFPDILYCYTGNFHGKLLVTHINKPNMHYSKLKYKITSTNTRNTIGSHIRFSDEQAKLNLSNVIKI